MKKFILGLVSGFVIAITGTAFANGGQVLANIASFNFVVNGQPKQVNTKPLEVNGTSYLPVRELANLLGYDVTFKADTWTIELTSATENQDTVGNPNTSTDANQSEWMDLREVLEKAGGKVENGTNTITLHGKSFRLPESDGVHEIQLDNGEIIHIKKEKRAFFLLRKEWF